MINILIVDDIAIMRQHLIDIINIFDNKIKCHEAASGYALVHRYKSIQPDIVFLDISMPYEDGLIGLHKILTYDKDATICIVSMIKDPMIIELALNLGANRYFTKPYDTNAMLAYLGVTVANQI